MTRFRSNLDLQRLQSDCRATARDPFFNSRARPAPAPSAPFGWEQSVALRYQALTRL